MTDAAIVIAGAGQAGFQTAASLRQGGHTGPITLIGDEPGLPYQRPPLSKAYMLGKIDAAALAFRPAAFFADNGVTLHSDRVTAIDRTARRVALAGGGQLGYDHLVLATGARNRPLAVPGADLDGVMGLRTRADADAIGTALGAAARVAVVGAGFIGLEFAAVAAALGKEVHVIELAPRVMARAVSEAMSAHFAAAHRGWGVQLHFGASLARIEGADGRVSGIVTAAGARIAADLVVYGIGVLPNTELAADAGLEVANGIVVDTLLSTADPAISAIGDCAAFPAPHDGRLLRLESVQNAADQARAVAARLTGRPTPYAAVPWFWSDQADQKLQMVGLAQGHDRSVIAGDPASGSFSVLLYRGDRLIAVESVNRAGDFMTARKLLAGTALPTPAEATAPGFEFRGWKPATS